MVVLIIFPVIIQTGSERQKCQLSVEKDTLHIALYRDSPLSTNILATTPWKRRTKHSFHYYLLFHSPESSLVSAYANTWTARAPIA